MSTLSKTFATVKTLEGSHLEMNSLDVTLYVSERKKTMWTCSCGEVGGVRAFKCEPWRERRCKLGGLCVNSGPGGLAWNLCVE